MIIQHIETFPLYYPLPMPYGDANGIKSFRTCYYIRITTSDGIEGWGECVDWLPTLQNVFHQRIIPFLIGQSAMDRNKLVRTISKWHPGTSSAVSMALTEIMARGCGVSVCSLWGGAFREIVPVYASFQSYSEQTDWQKHSLKAIEKTVSEGYNRIKVKIGGKPVADDQQHIGEVQALLQRQIQLALDANQSYDMSTMLEWQTLLQNWHNIMWIEEPLQIQYVAEYAKLRNRISAPLAGGENMKTAASFVPLLTQHALDLITPDPQCDTGVDGYRDMLKLARCFGIRATPHTYDGALSCLYALFAQACMEPWSKMGTDSIEPVEWDVMDNPFSKLIPIRPSNGEVTLPSGSGIGVEIDLEMLEFYKWDGTGYA